MQTVKGASVASIELRVLPVLNSCGLPPAGLSCWSCRFVPLAPFPPLPRHVANTHRSRQGVLIKCRRLQVESSAPAFDIVRYSFNAAVL